MSIMKRAVAATGALALALVGTIALSAPASAAVPGNIDPARDGHSSITVHKHAQPSPVGAPGNGTDVGPLADPLAQVDFTIYRLDIDLNTTAGWDAAEEISTAIAGGAVPVPNADPATSVTIGGASYAVGAGRTEATATSGAADFDDLDFGVYLVVEGADHGDNNITSKAAPFIVSVPFATGSNTWLYDVHAYPKNSVTAISKTIVEPGAGSAEFQNRDLVRWAVDLSVPNLTNGGSFTSFSIVDTIDNDELQFVATPPTGVAGNSVTVTDAGGAVLAVPAGSYTWNPDPATGETLTVSFTPAGRTWLANNAQGGTVTASILTRLVNVVTDGAVTNDATGNINDGTVTTTADAPEGELAVLKFADTPAKTGLAGATFVLYTSAAAAATNNPADRVLVNGVSEFGPTADDGALLISNLRPGDYWLVEIVQPVGYLLDATPHAVTVLAGQANPVNAVNYIEVENTQVPPWELPLTGGNGGMLFAVGGAGLLLLAAGAALLVARRKGAHV